MSEESLKYKTKKGLYWSFLSQMANNGMQFIVGIFMARMLSPEDYGITALPAIFMAIASFFINGGFGTALVRKEEVTESDLSTAFYYSMSVGALCYVILFFASPFIADFYNTPVLIPLIRITALNFLIAPFGTPQSVIITRKLEFKKFARMSVVNKIIGAVTGIVLAYTGYGLWALVYSGLVSSIIGTLQLWCCVQWLPKASFSKISFRYLWGFGNKMIGANMIDLVYNNVAPIFIGKVFSPASLGIYNRANGYATMPAVQLQSVLAGVTFPVLSKMQGDDDSLARNYRRMIRTSAFISFPIGFMLAALSRPIIILMITEKWEACILLLQILCFERMTWPISGLNKNMLQVKGRSDLLLRVESIKKPLLFIVTIIALPFGLVAYCYSQWICCIIGLTINTYYTGKLLNLGLLKQAKDIWPTFILSCVMGGVIMLSNTFFVNMYYQIVFGVLLGGTTYILGAVLFNFEELNDVIYLLNRKK